MLLKAIDNTYLKIAPQPANQLHLLPIADTTYPLSAKAELEIDYLWSDPLTNHSFIVLKSPIKPGLPLRWCLYNPHFQSEGNFPGNNPKETPSRIPTEEQKVSRSRGNLFKVPGISHHVGEHDPIYSGSNFTWGEATKGGSRVPVREGTVHRIVKAAKYMDQIRQHLGGKPIGVTSWFRDPFTNRRVGGAPISQHLEGWAVDFFVSHLSSSKVFQKLKHYHKGGLAVGNDFIHIDLRGNNARWTYPGGPQLELW